MLEKILFKERRINQIKQEIDSVKAELLDCQRILAEIDGHYGKENPNYKTTIDLFCNETLQPEGPEDQTREEIRKAIFEELESAMRAYGPKKEETPISDLFIDQGFVGGEVLQGQEGSSQRVESIDDFFF